MKRGVGIAIVVFALSLLATGSGAENQPEKRVMNYLAVMDLRCGKGVDQDIGVALTDVVIEELVKLKKYTLIDRANRDKILGEVGFQMIGCVDESCTVEAGRILGVGKIAVGSITKIGDTYLVSLQLINVETAAVEIAERETCKKCELSDLINTVAKAARKLMGETTIHEKATPTKKVSFTGNWKTNYGPMTLKQTGNTVKGSYEYRKGRIDRIKGEVTGKRFDFKWIESTQKSSQGDGYFIISDDGKSFHGKWRSGYSGPWAGDWKGTRK